MFTNMQVFNATVMGVLGLLIGSFLNVVIYRLPKMMQRQWEQDCAEQCGKELAESPTFNLMLPRSACPHCGHAIAWFENIPVVSYIFLRGKCSACKAGISLRYPLVEVVTACLFAVAGAMHGLSLAGAAWSVFAAALVCLFLIDFDTQLLPDAVNYPLLWLGLLAAAMGLTVPLKSAVWGAALGYLSLWAVFQVHHLLTGKMGMGHGDFKLLAALGAWFGAEHLIAIVLLSSVVGALLGIALLVVGRMANKNIPMPFGPFLAGAGLLLFVVGPHTLAGWLPFAFPFTV